MANKPYENFVLESYIKDQLDSHLDMLQFVATDVALSEKAGMTAKINVYTATEGTETLAKGEGNTKTIEATYDTIEVPVVCLQNRTKWYDEDEMEDPIIVETDVNKTVVDLTNQVNKNAVAEFEKATLKVYCDAFDEDAVIDACGYFPEDNEDENAKIFALVNPADRNELRKALKKTLQYVEAYARNGYLGTVNGVNFYGNNLVTKGQIIFAIKGGVRFLPKKGLEVEYERNGNTRETIRYTRKYGAFALTDATKVVLLIKGEAPATYSVTYDGNGSDGGTAPVDANSPYESGATVTVLGNTGTLTKTGKVFGGWNTAADGTGTAYAAADTFTIAANTTLYAVWGDE